MAKRRHVDLNSLAEIANSTAVGMRKAMEGKPPEAETRTDARSFEGIANMLQQLSLAATDVDTRCTRMLTALERIANLKVRGATELLENGNWKKIASELQAIAQEAVTKTKGR